MFLLAPCTILFCSFLLFLIVHSQLVDDNNNKNTSFLPNNNNNHNNETTNIGNNNQNLRTQSHRQLSSTSTTTSSSSSSSNRILRQTEPCTLYQRDRQDIPSADNNDPSSRSSSSRYDEWYCELRDKDRYENEKQFVKVEGLQEDDMEGKASGHTTLLADSAQFINGVLFVLPHNSNNNNNNGKDDSNSDSLSGNNPETNKDNDADGDEDGEEESSLDNVQDDLDQILFDMIFGGTNGEGEEDGDGATPVAEDMDGTLGDGDGDLPSPPQQNIDNSGSTIVDGGDGTPTQTLPDLTLTEDLDEAVMNGGSNGAAVAASGTSAANQAATTGSDSFSFASFSSGSGGPTGGGASTPNVFNHNDNDGDDQRKRTLKSSNNHPTAVDMLNPTLTFVHSVLVVRVIANDAMTTLSRNQLSNAIFGTDGNDLVNLKERFDKCSHGRLTMEPFNGTTTSGRLMTSDNRDKAGILNVRINMFVQGQDPDAVMEAVLTQAEKRVGRLEGQFDHVMLCLPPGTMGNWKSFGFVHHWLTVYNDDWCASPSAQVHEIGHNLGLGPSLEEYQGHGDQTGMMGTSYRSHEFPRMCFSPARSWQLGWYPDKRLELHSSDLRKLQDTTTPGSSGSLTFRIVGVDDYRSISTSSSISISGTDVIPYQGDQQTTIEDTVVTSNEETHVLVKIHSGITKYYLGFNRQKGINQDVVEAPDLVTVQSQTGKHHDPAQRKAELGVNDVYTISTFNPQPLKIKVKEINTDGENYDYAEIEISF